MCSRYEACKLYWEATSVRKTLNYIQELDFFERN